MDNCFYEAGTSASDYTTTKPIVMKYYSSCNTAKEYAKNPPSTVETVDLGPYVASHSLDNQSRTISIDNSKEVVSAVNSDVNKTVIEDETDWVTITVNKKTVDETVTETQTNSQSVESVEENKSEEEETQE